MYDISNPNLSLFESIGLLTGLKPDASILVVDVCDSDDYIQDSIGALRIMGQSATILVVINSNFPSDQKSIRYEYRDRMDVLESKYDMSIVDLRNDED